MVYCKRMSEVPGGLIPDNNGTGATCKLSLIFIHSSIHCARKPLPNPGTSRLKKAIHSNLPIIKSGGIVLPNLIPAGLIFFLH